MAEEAAAEKGGAPAEEEAGKKEDLLKYKIVKKSYILYPQKRFEYVKTCVIKKRVAEKEETGLAKMLKPLLARLMGKKE